MSSILWVFANPATPHLSVLDRLPESTTVLVSNEPSYFAGRNEQPDVLFNCTGNGAMMRALWPKVSQVRWIHSFYAGVENMLIPELRESDIPVTNSRGVFKRTLGEFVALGCLFFAKDLRRMLANQAKAQWVQYDMEELQGKTMVIVGYGEIGRAAAERCRPFGMKIIGVRRRPELSQDDPLLDESHGFADLDTLLPNADYIVCAAPQTPDTIGLITEARFRAMKPSAVFLNVGRGTISDENALIQALKERWIRGAVLDVFHKEPLAPEHPFWKMDNVLLSPHTADHTSTWQHEAVEFFVDNFKRFERGEPLQNIVDKQAGY